MGIFDICCVWGPFSIVPGEELEEIRVGGFGKVAGSIIVDAFELLTSIPIFSVVER